jgi:hypothetical protein
VFELITSDRPLGLAWRLIFVLVVLLVIRRRRHFPLLLLLVPWLLHPAAVFAFAFFF